MTEKKENQDRSPEIADRSPPPAETRKDRRGDHPVNSCGDNQNKDMAWRRVRVSRVAFSFLFSLFFSFREKHIFFSFFLVFLIFFSFLPIPCGTDDGWGGWTTHTNRNAWRMGGFGQTVKRKKIDFWRQWRGKEGQLSGRTFPPQRPRNSTWTRGGARHQVNLDFQRHVMNYERSRNLPTGKCDVISGKNADNSRGREKGRKQVMGRSRVGKMT